MCVYIWKQLYLLSLLWGALIRENRHTLPITVWLSWVVVWWPMEKEVFLPISYPEKSSPEELALWSASTRLYGCAGSNLGPFVWCKTWKIWKELKREWLKMISLENGSLETKLKRFGLFSMKENILGSEERSGLYLNVDLNHWAQTALFYSVVLRRRTSCCHLQHK